MATELKQLVIKRGQIKGQLTRFTNFVNTCTESKLLELQGRLENLQTILSEFNTIQSQVEIAGEEPEISTRERELFENSFYDTQAAARQRILDFQTISVPGPSTSTDDFQPNVKLPFVTLPEFRGEYHKWSQFHNTFSALIDKNKNLSNAEKFYYLCGCLKGEAEQVLQELEVSDENYAAAWELLKERFENKRALIEKHIQAIFDIPMLAKESHYLLRKLLDEFNKHFRALKSLGEPTDNWDRLLIYLLKTKLDPVTKREWQQHAISLGDKLPVIMDFTAFITNRCRLLDETVNAVDKERKLSSHSSYKVADKKYMNEKTFSHFSTNMPICNYCKNSHYIYHCKDFLSLPVNSRISEIKKLKICLNCLRENHFSQNCRSMGCKKCNKRHNTLLHIENSENLTNSSASHDKPTVVENTKKTASEEVISVHCINSKNTSHVLLSTAIIHIKDYHGKLHKCRTLLDSGSQSNFMSKELFQNLNLQARKINLPVSGINQASTVVSNCTNAVIKSVFNAFEVELTFLILPEITANIPNFTFSTDELKIPSNLKLADPNFNVTGKIDLLLGAGIFWELLCVGQVKIGQGQPILQKSKLGWILSGPISIENSREIKKSLCNFSANSNLEDQLEMFWKIEELPISNKFTREELACEKHFVENVKIDESGHYKVSLPLKENAGELGESETNAMKRFNSLECKLMKNPDLRNQYISFMDEYLRLGHMSKLNASGLNTQNHFYLPHHGVIKEDSVTTKLRVVFDASCKTSSGISLNDVLMVGPTIQDDLFAILLRFRKHNYVLTADIAKMYRQVNVIESQRNLQRILWRADPNEPLEHYCLNTITYGTACAAFLAIRALHEVAYENEHSHPISSRIILSDFYVDDLITGSDTPERAMRLKHELTKILSKRGFELRKWVSNEPLILESSEQKNALEYYIMDDKGTKALGILWNANKDILKYNIRDVNIDLKHVTKRIILSTISQIFDPLGLIGPAVIRAKIMMQQLWQLKMSWDESLPIEMFTAWLNFIRQISALNKIEIDRHALIRDVVDIQLHGFCDASMIAYGACLFLRSRNSNGEVYVKLLCAKSRVAPLKSLSLPRLELCGALLLAQITHKTLASLNINITSIFLWSDSTIVLSWLAAQPCTWQTFVSNRVSQIQQLTLDSNWRHVASADNPADIISRGIEPTELIHTKLWWQGPKWLNQDADSWPNGPDIKLEIDVPEARKTNISLVNIIPDHCIFNRYSSLFKLQRVTAYCLRFVKNCSSNRNNKVLGNLTNDELSTASVALIKLAQWQEFGQDKHDLERSGSVSRNSKLLSLNPFLDSNKIIRVGGRIENASIAYDRKHPIVLPEKHPLTKLIIKAEHHKQLHAGAQAVLASLRLCYWPLNGRSAVRSVLRKCVTCFRVKPNDIPYQMGQLPASRVTATKPFNVCGVDYAGPFNIKDGKLRNRKIIKAYVCIFICFSTKAVHIEVVGDLSTNSFLNALKRFVSRRGLCSNIYSDNATNFIGADNIQKKIHDSISQTDGDIATFLSRNRITWHYIPPRSPHFGGLWEAAVKSAKHHMKRVIGTVNLTFEELSTVMTQIEAVLNSRPLIPLSNDPHDLVALSPGHFLIGDYLTAVPQEDVSKTPVSHLSKFKLLQQMTQHFWARWSREYLSSLQQRSKWKRDGSPQLQPGLMVVLKEDNTPPLLWKLGRIAEVHPGQDGVVRVISVKTCNGVVRRAVNKVCMLPIDT